MHLKVADGTLVGEVVALLNDWDVGAFKNTLSRQKDPDKEMEYVAEIVFSLPNQLTSTRIVHFSLQTLGWIHCALRVDQFLAEHEAFQNSMEVGSPYILQNHGWMSIYYSVLTVRSTNLASARSFLFVSISIF